MLDFDKVLRMKNSPNEVHIWGYVVRDAEFRMTKAGCPLCQFSIYYFYNWKDKQKIFLFDVVQFGNSAMEVVSFLKAGQYVEIWGRLEQDKWRDDEGKTRSKTKIVATRIEPHDSNEAIGGTEDVGDSCCGDA